MRPSPRGTKTSRLSTAILLPLALTVSFPALASTGPDPNGKFWTPPYYVSVYPRPTRGPFNSISEATQKWWSDWKDVYPTQYASGCYFHTKPEDPYNLYHFPNNIDEVDGYDWFQSMPLQCPPAYSEGNGGWGVVWGTGHPASYFLKKHRRRHKGKGCDACKGEASSGDPIEIATGNMYTKETDYVAADARLQFSRSYNSTSKDWSNLGTAWRGSYDSRLDPIWIQSLSDDGDLDTSSGYTDPESACRQGFAEIVAASHSPDLYAGHYVDYVANPPNPVGLCKEYNQLGAQVAILHILSNDVTYILPSAPTLVQVGVTLHADDGSDYDFYCAQGTCSGDQNVSQQLSVDASGNYTLTDDDGTKERFDATGTLLSRTWKDGYQQTISHNGNGPVLSVVDSRGRTIVFNYDTADITRLASLTTPDGTITYTQDASGRLATVQNATGTRTYQYTNAAFPNALTGIVDENTTNGTPYATWSYDANGLANGSANTGPAGPVNSVLISHGDASTATVTDATGTLRTYHFQDPFGNPALTSIDGPVCLDCSSVAGHINTYDANGYLYQSTDWNGNLSEYAFSSGLLTQRIEAKGSTSQRTFQEDWDTALRNPTAQRVLDASGALQAKVAWEYNAAGAPLARCEEDPTVSGATSYACVHTGTAPAGVRRSTYTYCTVVDGVQCPLVGLLLSVDGPRTDATDVTQYAYYMTSDLSGCGTVGGACHYLGDLKSVTDAQGRTVTVNAYDRSGRAAQLQDPNGVVTDFTYNGRGWVTQTARRGTDNASTTDDQIVGYTYDNTGNVTRVTAPDGSYLALTYDSAHRLTDVAQKGPSNTLYGTIHYTLDAAGNSTKDDTKDPSGVVKRSIQRVFNNLGQLQIIANANVVNPVANPTIAYAYDANGNANVVTDGRGTVTNNLFDALNRLYHVDQDPGTAPHIDANTGLTFDALDRVTNVQDPHGLNTQYVYDGLGNLKQLVSPDTGSATSTYDAAGNVLTRTDARGIKTTYTYDVLNRVATIRYPTTSLNVTLTYDNIETNCTLAVDQFPKGHLTRVNDASGLTKFCYDRFGRMTKKSQTIGAANFQTFYTYDLANRITQVRTPTATLIKYTRNGIGRVTAVKYRLSGQSTDTTVVSAVTYYPFGPVASITYANGRVLNRTYDQDYVISGVTDTGTGGLNLNFGRDVLGNLTQVTSGATGNNFTYDALNRLTDVKDLTNNPVWTYSYDATGNRLSKQAGSNPAVPYTYGSSGHQLLAVGSTSRTYDAMGNTTAIGTNALSFKYDNTGRMSEVDSGAGNTPVMQYATNGIGQRVEKYLTGNSAATQFTIFDEAGHQLGDYDGSANRVRENVWMDGMPVAVISGTGGTVSYVEPDHLGTPRAAFDATSNSSVWNLSLVNDAFGESAPTGSLALNMRFPGQTFDAESGLNFNYFRDYDSATGRYLQSDPIGLLGGITTYGYVGGNPLSFSDPFGLAYYDKTWGVEDYIFGPTYWMRQKMGLDPELPQGAVDFAAGTGDGVSLGATDLVRDAMGTNDQVNKCSGAYLGGELTGMAIDTAIGGAAGWEAGGERAAGKEFSHWIPNRMGGPRSLWNGNYVSAEEHALSDPYRYRFMPRSWKADNPMPNVLSQQWDRIPNVYKGAGAGAGASGAAAAARSGCGCH